MNNEDLIYVINHFIIPLPHSLLNYVFDFGSLNKEDEINIIGICLKILLKKMIYLILQKNWYNLFKTLLEKKNDISFVSLTRN